MSALFDFNAFLIVVLLTICTCTYVKTRAPRILSVKTGWALPGCCCACLLANFCSVHHAVPRAAPRRRQQPLAVDLCEASLLCPRHAGSEACSGRRRA